MKPVIESIDHIVITVASLQVTFDFYEQALGFAVEDNGPDRPKSLLFGNQKMNVHEVGSEFSPRATLARPGTGDFCLLTSTPVQDVKVHLQAMGVDVFEGPVPRNGAVGPLNSIYFRDPDGNLVEVSNPV